MAFVTTSRKYNVALAQNGVRAATGDGGCTSLGPVRVEQAQALGGVTELIVGKARLLLKGAVVTAVLHSVLRQLLP